ncbi:hypothetical protein EJ04DRAFT_593732 [Polyplosphaeria fusca]|uniref:Peptidase S33 tripeptidyl aminopeptidase-like C-terminal domain-containing protein n=1 Tax=Polyplosphaeria fusca TaxID=682080 RepID=A0A9P4QID8_9PLEO|nr:hypothetical protein EJ04DRAFT_593732 [Polyplosphaeria fusca]
MDPRGVNNSGPYLNCFADDYTNNFYNSHIWLPTHGYLDPSSRDSFWRQSGATAAWCSQTLNATAKYVNTPATARDMLHYAEKLAASQNKNPDEAKVDYYGASYGSVLGSTFARLYPDRMGRFIMDGIADNSDYYAGTWEAGVLQSDAALASFFIYCFAAGPKCQFYRNDSSADAMQARFDAILEDLKTEPIVVADPELVEFPYLVTHIDLLGFAILELYSYIQGFLRFAIVFSELEQRNATTLVGLLPAAGVTKGLVPRDTTFVPDFNPQQARVTIACNDQNGRNNLSSPEKFGEYVQKNVETSKYFGELWSGLVPPRCWNWKIEAPETQVISQDLKRMELERPILWLANKLDPVAASQEKMAEFFPNSRILTQDSIGHGIGIAVSNCTTEHVQNFLATGELPAEDVLCPVEYGPFDLIE